MQNAFKQQQVESKYGRDFELLKMKNEEKVSSLRKEVVRLQLAIKRRNEVNKRLRKQIKLVKHSFDTSMSENILQRK